MGTQSSEAAEHVAHVASSPRGSWRAKHSPDTEKWRRRFRRAFVTLIAFCLLIWLGVLLLSPFGRSTPLLITAAPGGAASSSRGISPYPPRFVGNDVDAISGLASVGNIVNFGSNDRRQAGFQRFRNQLLNVCPEDRGVVLYLRAFGIDDGGRPALVWESTGNSGERQLYSVGELLADLQECSAKAKLVVLDLDELPPSASAGDVVNDFITLVAQTCNTARPAPIWLLVSHQQEERPYSIDVLGRSALSFWLERGLRGEADVDGNRLIGLDELHRYVASNVSAFVRHMTDGTESQTPILLACGGEANRFAKPLDLIPIPQRSSWVGQASTIGRTKLDIAKSESAPGPTATPGPPDSGDKDVQQSPASSEGDAPNSDGKPTNQTPAAVEPPDANALLQLGWQLRDDLEAGRTSRADPRRTSPSLWRGYLERLLACERGLHSGIDDVESAAATELRQLVLPLQAWAEGKDPRLLSSGRLASLLTRPVATTGDWQPHSFGMADLKARVEQRALSPDVATTISTFDRLVAASDREAFAKFISELPPTYDCFAEIQFARALLERPDIDTEVLQQVLMTRRQAESLAAHRTDVHSWFGTDVLAADALRSAAEWLLLDAAIRPEPEQLKRLLRDAESRYQKVGESLEVVDEAYELRDESFHEAPYFVEWAVISSVSTSVRAPSAKDVIRFLDAANELQAILENPRAGRLEELSNAIRRIRARRDQLREGYSNEYVRSTVAAGAENAGDLSILKDLRETPLLRARERATLEASVPQVEGTLVSTFRNPTILRDVLAVKQNPRLRTPEIARLYVRLSKLGISEIDSNILKALQDAMQRVAETHRDDTVVVAAFEQALAEFYESLATRVESVEASPLQTESIEESLETLIAADRASRLVESQSLDQTPLRASPQLLLERRKLAGLLAWQATRADRLASFAAATESDFLSQTATLYRNAGNQLAPGIAVTDRPQALTIAADSRVSLTKEDTCPWTLRLSNGSNQPRDVWILMDYNPSLLTVSNSSINVYRSIGMPSETESHNVANASPTHLNRPDIAGEPPTLSIKGSGEQTLEWTLERRGSSAPPTKLTIWVISHSVGDREGSDVQIKRQSILIDLPYPKLFEFGFVGEPGTVITESDSVVLSPFPNRKTPYQISIRSTQSTPKCTVAVYSITSPLEESFPSFAIEPETANTLIDRYTNSIPVTTLSELALPTDGTPVAIPFPEMGGMPNSPLVPLDHGLLLVATDAETGRRVLRHAVIRPQHPSRYLEPTVRFDSESQRLLIRVAARDAALLPTEGCEIECDLDGLEKSATRRLNGVVLANQPADMFVELLEEQSFPLALRITADGYPRAFLYSIPRVQPRTDIPRDMSAAAVRILAPQPGFAIKSPTPFLSAHLQIDAPVGTDWNVARVEAGIDRDRDRELDHENPLVLHSDREVRVALDRLGPAGHLSVRTEVEDFQLNIPTADIGAGRVNVLSRLVLNDRSVWSRPVDVVFDDEAPVVTRLLLGKGTVLASEPLQASVEVSDGALSGVGSVAMAIDLERTGEFGGETKPVPATKSGDRWTATLDTSKLTPGKYGVLARATDAVGNESRFAREWVEVVTVEQMSAERSKALNSLQGFVTYRGRPMSGFTVQLVPTPKQEEDSAKTKVKPLAPVKTDDEGAFSQQGIPPGSYSVEVEGLYANARRKGTETVEIPPGPEVVPPLNIEVDPR